MLGNSKPMDPAQNPWIDLVEAADGRYAACDGPHLAAYNAALAPGQRRQRGLDLELMPEPWIGDVDAPVVLLLLNPGWHDGDFEVSRRPFYRQRHRANLRKQQSVEYPLYYLDPELAGTPGADWWTIRAAGEAIRRYSPEVVARTICALEYHAYHSETYQPIPFTLPSQHHTFYLLREAMRRNAVIIALRGHVPWVTAVPELLEYQRLHFPNSSRAVAISPVNCPSAWPAVQAALQAA